MCVNPCLALCVLCGQTARAAADWRAGGQRQEVRTMERTMERHGGPARTRRAGGALSGAHARSRAARQGRGPGPGRGLALDRGGPRPPGAAGLRGPGAGPGAGRGGRPLRAPRAAFRGGVPDAGWTIGEQIAQGTTVVTRLGVRGTFSGPLLGLAPPGRPATLTGVAICRFARGRLVELWLQA